ncbi:MAG: hypothetical protein ACR2ID_01720, partial [Chthoniobacterales bacterium]
PAPAGGGGTVVTGWVYDEDGNMTERPTADRTANPPLKQTFAYDVRNRPTQMRWNNGMDFSDFGYDDAGRLKSARNPYSTITRLYDVAGRLADDKQLLALTLNTPPSNVPAPSAIVSRKTHGLAGTFDINLMTVGGEIGTECRSGGSYTLRITFPGSVAVNDANVSAGIGSVIGSPSSAVSGGNTVVTVALGGVSDVQILTLRLTIASGGNTGQVSIPMRVLVGDTNNDGAVNTGDYTQTRAASGQSVAGANFRCDQRRWHDQYFRFARGARWLGQ